MERSTEDGRGREVPNAVRRMDNINSAVNMMEELGFRFLVKEPKNYRIHKSIPKKNKEGMENSSTKITSR